MLDTGIFNPYTFAVLGLLVGSFLNVVIHRLPAMMEQAWARECAQANGADTAAAPAHDALNLWNPPSHCPHCKAPVRWYQNIPVLSYLWLRARCGSCSHPISLRYPLIEVTCAILFALCAVRWSNPVHALAWSGFCAALLCLSAIDWDTTLLPDDITLPLLWAGLIGAQLGWTGQTLPNALWGSVAGYLSLWAVYWSFKLATGKEGMGYGDFKLLAALGAWLGWEALIPVVLMASSVGAVVGIGMKLTQNLREGLYVPFGPFLATGGVITALVGADRLLRLVGL
ncbi:MAG: prepilin peptidase [Rhodoferax sp.]